MPAAVDILTPGWNEHDENTVLSGAVDHVVDVGEVSLVWAGGVGIVDSYVTKEVWMCRAAADTLVQEPIEMELNDVLEFRKCYGLYDVESLSGAVLKVEVDIGFVEAVEKFPNGIRLPEKRLPRTFTLEQATVGSYG